MAAARTLNLGEGLSFPLDVVSRRTAILGQTDTGKTSTAVVMIEEAAAAGAQFVIIDPTDAWYGLRSSADGEGPGVDCVVMGGDYGDVPLDQGAGKVVADLVANEGYNVVLSLKRMPSWSARLGFVADFLAQLYESAHSQILVVIDEAHRFAPQSARDTDGNAARCLGAVTDVVLLGRKQGLATVCVTQRPARLHKDVLEMSEIVIAHRLRGNNDRKAFQGWIEEVDLDVKAIMAEVGGLAKGVARVSAPTLGINDTYTIRKKSTFDSSKSIGIGEVAIEPKGRAVVDLDALRDRMAATIERAKADDPKALKRRIKELEAQLAARPAETTEIEVIQEVPVLNQRALAPLWELDEVLAELRSAIGSVGDKVADALKNGGQVIDREPERRRVEPSAPRREPRRQPAAQPPARRSAPVANADQNGDAPVLKAGARKILETLARHHPMRFTRPQVGTLTGFKVTGGTFQTYWGVLKRAGYIEENEGEVLVTDAGLDRAGVVPESPASTEEMVAMWGARLKKGAREMLDLLVKAHPSGYDRDALAAELGMTASGGTFQTYLGTIRRNGLVEVHDGVIYASETLFIGAAA